MRPVSAAVSGLATLLLAVGCGSGSGPTAPATPGVDALSVVRAAAKATAGATSMRVSGSMAEHLRGVTPSEGAAPVDVDVTGDFSGVVRSDPLGARLTVSNLTTNGSALGARMRELLTPDAMYLKMPQLAAQTGTPWVVMRFADMKRLSGVDLRQVLSQARQMQPAQYVEQLAATGHIRDVGRESVRGTSTTHYSGTVPLDELLAHYSADVRAQLAPTMRSAGFTGARVDVWLDDDGLARRITSSSVGGEGSVEVHLDVLAYDVPVHVSPPPPGQVTDLARLAGQQPGT